MPCSRPYNAISTTMCMAGSELELGIDVHGIHIISLTARFRTATRSSSLFDSLTKIRAVRNSDRVTLHAFFKTWEESMLHAPWPSARWKRIIFLLDAKCVRTTTTLLDGKEQTRDYSRQIAKRATKIPDAISSHRIAQNLPFICNSSRTTRSRLAVGIILHMCNDMGTWRRFLTEEDDQSCRWGFQDQLDCLRNYNDCPRLAITCDKFWTYTDVRLWEDLFWHDLITQTTCLGLQ